MIPFGNTLYSSLISGGGTSPPYYRYWCKAVTQDSQCDEGSCGVGNPINMETATKRQLEVDFESPDGRLNFTRIYRSDLGLFRSNWRIELNDLSPSGSRPGCYPASFIDLLVYPYQVVPYCFPYADDPTNPTTNVDVINGGGFRRSFTMSGTSGTGTTGFNRDSLTKQGSGSSTTWRLHRNEANTDSLFDATGRLVSIQERDGQITTLTYSDSSTPSSIAPTPGLLIAVTNPFGRGLQMRYDSNGLMSTLIDPSGQQTTYTYQKLGNYDCTGEGCWRITSVTYPDGKIRSYAYDEAAYLTDSQGRNYNPVNLLTGITDENNSRLSIYKYDSGRAVSTEWAGGVKHYTVTYPNVGSSAVITDPLGSQRTYSFVNGGGLLKLSSISGPPCPSCGPSSQTFDSQGNIASQTDFNGNLTTYSYDLSRNLETQRVEASGTAIARTISTAWHPNWRLKIKQAEPKKLTIWVYNGQPDPSNGNAPLLCAPSSATVNGLPIGVLCKQIEQATTDTTGSAGLSPTVTGTTRVWAYTYNADGQVLTSNGPRTDVTDTTTYTYRSATDTSHSPAQYTRGDLYTITNAKGQVTTIPIYDLNGRPLQIVDSNGLTTTLTYSPRGWLTSRVVSGNSVTETTTYDYDFAGQLTKVTSPDGSYLNYTYDAAHRLTDITDNLGNTVHYTLDNMGNRTGEAVKDPSNALTRQITRVYDALNRLQTITGSLQ